MFCRQTTRSETRPIGSLVWSTADSRTPRFYNAVSLVFWVATCLMHVPLDLVILSGSWTPRFASTRSLQKFNSIKTIKPSLAFPDSNHVGSGDPWPFQHNCLGPRPNSLYIISEKDRYDRCRYSRTPHWRGSVSQVFSDSTLTWFRLPGILGLHIDVVPSPRYSRTPHWRGSVSQVFSDSTLTWFRLPGILGLHIDVVPSPRYSRTPHWRGSDSQVFSDSLTLKSELIRSPSRTPVPRSPTFSVSL